MNLFLTIVSFIFIATFSIGCTSMSNHNDLNISVDNKDGEPDSPKDHQKERPRETEKKLQEKASPPHLWKWADTSKKR